MSNDYRYQWGMVPQVKTKDIYKTLMEGIQPDTFLPRNRYDHHLLETVFPMIFSLPPFRQFAQSLKPVETPTHRVGADVPVMSTATPLSVKEVKAFRNDVEIFYKFMDSMGRALVEKSIPYEEIFACILDAVATSNYILSSEMATLH